MPFGWLVFLVAILCALLPTLGNPGIRESPPSPPPPEEPEEGMLTPEFSLGLVTASPYPSSEMQAAGHLLVQLGKEVTQQWHN